MHQHLFQLRQNLFQNFYAHALLAFTNTSEHDNTLSNEVSEQEAIGLALYFFNYSTWTGRPGLYVGCAVDTSRHPALTGWT